MVRVECPRRMGADNMSYLIFSTAYDRIVYFEIYFLFRCILIAFESVDNKLQVCFRAWSLFCYAGIQTD